ncbi:hypothetical protein B7P43_G00936 [Cryptotermes secundus]|uniref:Uncharacterized protein n=1 Tax=Cryptotermes secundus TaxID=105785 RepID=A0A2J7PG14_9NEOP|nr:hypothetical protein B7P43_G00936 [Cryptotermes secundus]
MRGFRVQMRQWLHLLQLRMRNEGVFRWHQGQAIEETFLADTMQALHHCFAKNNTVTSKVVTCV